jgi:hypothetical protein
MPTFRMNVMPPSSNPNTEAETDFLLAQWLRLYQHDTRACSSSLIINLKCTFIISNLQIVHMTTLTGTCPFVAYSVHTSTANSLLTRTAVSRTSGLKCLVSILWCGGFVVFPYYLKPERWLRGSSLARKISFLSKAK